MTKGITQSRKNIAYKNDTCAEVSKHLRKKLNKQNEYEVGEILICREYLKTKYATFSVNFEYEIIAIMQNCLKIKNITSTDTYDVPLKVIRTHFQFNYCTTCHSVQGSTISDSITIFDYKFFFVTRKWIWTAIGRARTLDDVYFYDYSEDEEFNFNLIRAYLRRKIRGYREQDRDAKREIHKEQYVDIDWLLNCVNKNCIHCGSHLYIDFTEGNVISNISADRVDNTIGHAIHNIRPACRWCNSCRSNK